MLNYDDHKTPDEVKQFVEVGLPQIFESQTDNYTKGCKIRVWREEFEAYPDDNIETYKLGPLNIHIEFYWPER